VNIAELFVRVRGDTTDVTRQLRGIEGSMAGVERASVRLDGSLQKSHLSTGKLRQEFQTLVRQLTGTAPVVTQLAGVMGEFAIGSALITGVLGGLAAVVLLYEKMTAGARKAKAEGDKLVKSLVDQNKAAYDATVQGQQLIELQAQMELDRRRKESGVGITSILGSILTGSQTISATDAAAQSQRIADAQTAVAQANANVAKTWQEINKPVTEHAARVATVTVRYNELRDAADKVNASIMQEKRDWWRSYIEKTGEAVTLTQQLNREMMQARPSVLDVFRDMTTVTTGPVDISDSVKIAGDQAKKINDAAADHAEMIKNAIWGSASALANSIVSALNFGGGGRGSNVGGGIGGTLGFALGSMTPLGPLGGAIGSIIGNIGGSLLGGLFDHKKAVDQNTAAVHQLTQAMIQNSPSGFRVASYRYDADLGYLGAQLRRHATRGGPNPLLVGT
jgi:hypothetical protein